MVSPNRVLAWSFYAVLFAVGIGTFFIHELAHWLTGVALGHDMIASPHHVRATDPMSVRDQCLVSAAGPLITIAQGIVGYWLVSRRSSRLGFALLYMAFFMRLIANAVSVFNPNDEARISLLLGIGTWTLPLVVVAGLFVLLFAASRRLKLRFLDQFFCYLVASVVVTLIVAVDMAFWSKS